MARISSFTDDNATRENNKVELITTFLRSRLLGLLDITFESYQVTCV